MSCRAELRGLGVVQASLSKHGGSVMAISVDPPKQALRLVRKLDLPFPILCDTKRDLIRSLGLAHEGGSPDGLEIPVPAHFLLDRDGDVLWRYRSNMVQDRPDPRDIVNVIEATTFGTSDPTPMP